MKLVEFSGSSPEAGWEPMVEWLRSEGLKPERVAAIAVDLDTLDAKVTEYRLRGGKKYIDHKTGDAARKTRMVSLKSAPPQRHPLEPA